METDVKYTEGSAAVTVPGVGRVERGEAITPVSEQQRQKLIKQGWQEVKPAAPSSPPKATPKVAPQKED